jgi:hypothetical protein
MIVQPGKRDDAMQFISAWLRRSARKYVHIVDPFFGPRDLEFLKLIRTACADVVIRVLTSRKHQPTDFLESGLQEAYQHHWRVRISADIAPDAEIWVASVGNSGESPIHDRWIVTDGSGMEIGTSLNSLGGATAKKECKISVFTPEELRRCEERVSTYLINRRRELNGEKVTYWPVML